ncbi:hypothetical protein Y032_0008g237 [Ancylostoma ceylanicum]|uniref:Uncharacterized protein n=1 Tax=Ancylostoma ceylanicum TaxID=53326 RepID=A0A016VLI9_9BILA|nr:hypothetical protein Y032_0008g237 [Ancylostoma ceylanicum]
MEKEAIEDIFRLTRLLYRPSGPAPTQCRLKRICTKSSLFPNRSPSTRQRLKTFEIQHEQPVSLGDIFRNVQ